MAKLTRSNFPQLLTPIHKKICYDSYGEIPEQWSQIVDVETAVKPTLTYVHEGGFGLWDSNTEGNTFNSDEMSEGDTVTLTVGRFDKSYLVTWELIQDDQYNVFKGEGKGGSASKLGKGLRATLETRVANVLLNGFSNVGYDGTALFSSNHTLYDSSAVGQNLISGALNPANVKAGMTLIRNQVDSAGLKIQANAKQLIVSPDNEFAAKEIVGSTNQAFEMSNTENVVGGLKPIVLDYLTGTKWFLRDPNFKNLVLAWREKPIFDSERVQGTMDMRMYGYARWAEGYYDWRGLAGSLG
ncbi:Mu-like prophage major head subunit gpT family protein [Paenibacillus anseongense]|uniref:phage major capsid protein n=1 Tax=Paenibacillus anseongense TaxID=2682845 RepID=UPI002DB8A04A|nr:Mu-like prophage major head subunit gpT family protein [Paenibacillus anseongense]MEC0265139.1 Mu-like prophage major head subunit gpT family protein [Paenibacillus anseongense]